MTLVILAGGFGTRFGGPKQFFKVGPKGECLLHYAIRDAAAAGFNDFLMVTRREIKEVAEDAVYPGLPPELRPRMVFQEAPGGKARGTGHAILSCEGQLVGRFGVVNGDDYYGPQSYVALAKLLGGVGDGRREAVTVPFEVAQTLSPVGGVSRARVEVEGGLVKSLSETHGILRGKDGQIWGETEERVRVRFEEKDPVSMNLFGFTDGVFDGLRAFAEDIERMDEAKEIGLPQFLNRSIERGEMQVRYEISPETWFGMTYVEEVEDVKRRLAGMN